jgi:hypothetical protein
MADVFIFTVRAVCGDGRPISARRTANAFSLTLHTGLAGFAGLVIATRSAAAV